MLGMGFRLGLVRVGSRVRTGVVLRVGVGSLGLELGLVLGNGWS